jgi:hypothetical protein
LSSPKNIQEFYPFAVNIIYAIIIALSFEIAAKVFVPLDTIVASYDSFLRGSALLLSYFFIISGWIGYTKSIVKRPHKENKLGNARFVMDLIILFLAFYLLSQTDPEKFKSFIVAFSTFIWILPASFLTYLIWDGLKYFEYKSSPDEKQTSISRWRITMYYFAVLLVLAILYSFVVIPYIYDRLVWDNHTIWELLFLVASFIAIGIYRKRKWLVPDTSFPKKARKRRTSAGPSG